MARVFLNRSRRYGRRSVKRAVSARMRRVGSYRKYTKAAKALQRLATKIPRAVSLFPERKVLRHKYVENISIPIAGAAGFIQNYRFAANGMYDPNITGTGHQPLMFDEAAAKWSYYTVVSSTIRVTFSQTATNQANYGIVVSNDTALTNIPTEALEQYSHTKPLITSNMVKPLTLRKEVNVAKFFKTDFAGLMAEDTFKCPTTSNGGTKFIIYYHIYGSPLVETVTLPAIAAQVEISYTAVWRDRLDIPQS